MKAVLVFLVTVITVPNCYSQKTTNFNALTKEDKEKYTLIITPVKKVFDKCNPRNTTYLANVFLTNNSNDTLKYIDWTCGECIWHSDNKGIWIYSPSMFGNCYVICSKTIIDVYTVPPHQIKKIFVYVTRFDDAISLDFRVGMILQRIVKKDDLNFYDNYYASLGDQSLHNLYDQTMNIIWSDKVKFPN